MLQHTVSDGSYKPWTMTDDNSYRPHPAVILSLDNQHPQHTQWVHGLRVHTVFGILSSSPSPSHTPTPTRPPPPLLPDNSHSLNSKRKPGRIGRLTRFHANESTKTRVPATASTTWPVARKYLSFCTYSDGLGLVTPRSLQEKPAPIADAVRQNN